MEFEKAMYQVKMIADLESPIDIRYPMPPVI